MGQSYRELIAWQKAMDFVMDIYRTTKLFPRDETMSDGADQSVQNAAQF